MDQRSGRAYYRELVINEDKSMEDSPFLHKAKPWLDLKLFLEGLS